MPGNCAIFRSWTTGDILTAADLTNSMTQIGVTNMTPSCLDDYSVDNTQMQLTVDPFPAGVESRATSTAGELERIRFQIKQILGEAQWYHDPDISLANTFLKQDFNYTFNGDFEIWGAGVSAAPTGYNLSGAGASVAKDTTNFRIGSASAALTRAGTDCHIGMSPQIEDIPGFGFKLFQGKTITVGCWVRATVANRARLRIDDTDGNTVSAFHTGGSAWEWLTVTRTLGASITALTALMQVLTGDTTAQFDGLTFVMGSSVSDFIPSGWRGRTSMFAFGTIPAQAQGTTSFFGPWGWAAAENDARFQVPFKCVLRRLHAATNGNVGGAGQTAAFTVRKDAVDTALTATINTGANVAQDITNEVSYNANQSLVLKVILSATTGNLVPTATVVVEEIP